MIGDRVKKVRIENKLTQKELGDLLGVSRDVIANIEYSRVEPREWFINLFCKEFNLNKKWLLNEEGEKLNIPIDSYSDSLTTLVANLMVNEKPSVVSILERLNDLSDDHLELIERLVKELQKK